jgi:predicted amidohydrolase
MSVVKVALLQISSSGTDQEANLRKGDQFCRQAASLGADIALFPEMEYAIPFSI